MTSVIIPQALCLWPRSSREERHTVTVEVGLSECLVVAKKKVQSYFIVACPRLRHGLIKVEGENPNAFFVSYSAVAQLVERQTVNLDVTGPSPVCGAKARIGSVVWIR